MKLKEKVIKTTIPAHKAGRWNQVEQKEVSLTLYSFDGRTWSTNKKELEEIRNGTRKPSFNGNREDGSQTRENN